jgi:hypothetical protein
VEADPDRDVDDAGVQADVLSFRLGQRNQISLAELLREMAEPTYGPYGTDTVERATRDLVHAGLVHRHGDFVFATRAAVHYRQLTHR